MISIFESIICRHGHRYRFTIENSRFFVCFWVVGGRYGTDSRSFLHVRFIGGDERSAIQSTEKGRGGGSTHTTNKAEIDNNPHFVESLVFACLIKERYNEITKITK